MRAAGHVELPPLCGWREPKRAVGRRLTVLAFGAPCVDAMGVYGTQLFNTSSCTTDDKLVPLAQAWLRGYQSTHGSSTPQAILVLGTSNSLTAAPDVLNGALTDAQMQASAQAWFTNVVQPVAAGLSGPAPVTVWAGSDIEQSSSGSWYGPGPSRIWVDAFGAAAAGSLSSNRRCSGNDPFRLADYGDNVLTGGWTNDDIYHVAWGAPVACAVPQIYFPFMAQNWAGLNQWAQANARPPIIFTGPMSRGGAGGTLSASDSWSQLAAATGQSSPYLTVIGALNAIPPDAPAAPVAIASDSSATVYWSAPASDGGSPVTGYTLTASAGSVSGPSKTVSGLPPVTSATIGGLTNATAYTFSVTATNAAGSGAASPGSNTIIPGRGTYHPLTPARIFDTRQGSGALAGGSTITVPVDGAGGVPADGVYAAVINVTVTNTTAPSYLTIYPAGIPQPLASSLNWTAGQTVPNLVEVAVGPGGQVNVFNAAGSTDVIFDVEGYVATPAATPGPSGLFNAVAPTRILDTRSTGAVGANSSITLRVAGNNGVVPTSGAAAVVLNVTVTRPSAASYLTVYPTGSRPTASNLNFTAGQTVPNRVIVPLDANGSISFYNAYGTVDVIADIGGWFTDATNPSATGTRFAPVPPTRILDTRSTQMLGPNQSMAVSIAGNGPIPNSGVVAVVVNATVTGSSAASYLTAWPDGDQRPLASDLNFTGGATIPNMVVVKVGSDGKIDLYNAAGAVDVVIDVMGWYG
ncbi:MAG TPA: fibronectin type III domain-containing protein [Candidatus Dormibacteraeota bacterium]|nr:fibronectin type III domain-containing protein [Candidatus Dormibacteraeota bacterium]